MSKPVSSDASALEHHADTFAEIVVFIRRIGLHRSNVSNFTTFVAFMRCATAAAANPIAIISITGTRC